MIDISKARTFAGAESCRRSGLVSEGKRARAHPDPPSQARAPLRFPCIAFLGL
jgi:hypothetical protein